MIALGSTLSVADGLGVSAAGAVLATAYSNDNTGFFPTIFPVYRIGGSTLDAPIRHALGDAAV